MPLWNHHLEYKDTLGFRLVSFEYLERLKRTLYSKRVIENILHRIHAVSCMSQLIPPAVVEVQQLSDLVGFYGTGTSQRQEHSSR